VYCNGKRDREAFDARLEFDIKLIPYVGDSSWVEGVIFRAKECLMGEMPESGRSCDFCAYRKAGAEVENSSKNLEPGVQILDSSIGIKAKKKLEKNLGAATLF
jgi:hypothetical protein